MGVTVPLAVRGGRRAAALPAAAGSGFLNEVRPSVSPVPPFPGGPWPRRGGPRRGSAGVRRERPGAARSSGEGPAGPPSAAPGLPRPRRAGGAGRGCCVRVGGEGRGGWRGGSGWRRQPPRGPRGALAPQPRRWAPGPPPPAPGPRGGKGRFLLPAPRLEVLRRDPALNRLCLSLPGSAGRLRSRHLLGISRRESRRRCQVDALSLSGLCRRSVITANS